MAARGYEISLRVLKNIFFTCEDIKFSRESSLGVSLVFI